MAGVHTAAPRAARSGEVSTGRLLLPTSSSAPGSPTILEATKDLLCDVQILRPGNKGKEAEVFEGQATVQARPAVSNGSAQAIGDTTEDPDNRRLARTRTTSSRTHRRSNSGGTIRNYSRPYAGPAVPDVSMRYRTDSHGASSEGTSCVCAASMSPYSPSQELSASHLLLPPHAASEVAYSSADLYAWNLREHRDGLPEQSQRDALDESKAEEDNDDHAFQRRLPSSGRPNPPSLLMFDPSPDLRPLRYQSRSMKAAHLLHRTLYFAHVPATLFLDGNILYLLIIVARSAEYHDTGGAYFNAWRFAVAIYVLATAIWLFGIVLVHDIYLSYFRRWHKGRARMLLVYLSAPAFHLSCIRSFSLYSFLWHIRLSALSDGGHHAAGWHALVIETAHLLMQNWPTTVSLLPRAALSLVLLLSTLPPSSATPGCDLNYINQNGRLGPYASAINSINLGWAAWRVAIVLVASATFWAFEGRQSVDHDRMPLWQLRIRARMATAVAMCAAQSRHETSAVDGRTALAKNEPTKRKRRSLSKSRPRNIISSRPDMTEANIPDSGVFSVPVHRRKRSTDSQGAAKQRGLVQLFAAEDHSRQGSPEPYARPFSSLDRRPDITAEHLAVDQSSDSESDDADGDEEEERLAWEQSPSLTPRGALTQAREELAQYVNGGHGHRQISPSTTLCAPTNLCTIAHSEILILDRDLDAIVEESEEEASLRRANSLGNRLSMSSRQSSLLRSSTGLGAMLEEDGTFGGGDGRRQSSTPGVERLDDSLSSELR